ncbi:uncharacterized protein [Bemisia tabaci]|uniref:uncharacterized protein isoform X2 n=1 Tax=Bemisia tabaci TaxID=7038 RepID=UPI003B2811F6
MLLRLCCAWLAVSVTDRVGKVSGASVKFDQSQTGEYNVQIHLKNLELYALLDESVLNAEYDYDYADLTEKPPKPTQAKPTEESLDCVEMTKYGVVYRKNSTKCSNMTAVAAAVAAFSTKPPITGTPTVGTTAPVGSGAGTLLTEAPTAAALTSGPSSSPPPQPLQPEVGTFALKKCGIGYFRDNLGRCRRIRKPHLPFLHMIHTPGVIKSFNGDVTSKLPSTTPSSPEHR